MDRRIEPKPDPAALAAHAALVLFVSAVPNFSSRRLSRICTTARYHRGGGDDL